MRTLSEVAEYQNSRILNKFRTQFLLSQMETEEIFTELKKFLWLCALRRKEFKIGNIDVPAKLAMHKSMVIIDELWHVFILHTEEYTRFCSLFLDGYIHHSPAASDFSPLTDSETALQLSYIWEKLGEETVVTWYDKFEEKYSPDNLSQLLRPHVFGKPCEDI